MSIRQTVLDFFSQEKWEAQESPEVGAVRAGYQGRNGRFVCYAKWNSRDDLLTFYAVPELSVPPQRLSAMIETVTRANFGLASGCFELDVDDGELRFRSSLEVEESRLTVSMVRRLVGSSLEVADRYLPALSAVAQSEIEPKTALAAVEQ